MRFDVTYEDGTSVTVEPGPADVLAFEKEHKTTLGKALATGSPLWTYFLVWHKLTRRGEGRTLDAWLDDVTSIKDPPDVKDGDADPTDGAPPSEESAPTV